jgi:glutathione S-transferase
MRIRAPARRLVREADQYLAHAMELMVEEILFKPPAEWNAEAIVRARAAFASELGHFESSPLGEEPVGAADFTVYPMIALGLRMERRKPDLDVRGLIGPRLRSWMKRVEALPYFERTLPPHWRAPKPA